MIPKSMVVRMVALSCVLVGLPAAAAVAAEESYDFPQVVGGQAVTPGQFPWLVRIVSETSGVCTGSLIADNWVLTAAHCGTPERVYITDAMPPSGGPEHMVWWIAPEEYIPHPGFNPNVSPVDFEDDIALIKLELNASDFPPNVDGTPLYEPTPIGLAASPSSTAGSIGNVTIAGFGFTQNGGTLPLVAEWAGGLPSVPAAACLFPTVASKELCYGTFPNNCPGDSGSAVFAHGDGGAYLQYGIVSIVTATCGSGNSRATYVPGHLDWINSQMSEHPGGPIKLGWELPGSITNGDVGTGVSNGQGWTYSPAGAIKSIKLYVDGKLEQEFPWGGDRGDVQAQHPDAPIGSGFSAAVSWPRFGPGNHQMMLEVEDMAGNKKTEVRTVKVVQILNGVNFVKNLSTAGASCAFASDSFSCTGLSFDQGSCSGPIEFTWSNAKQAFEATLGCDE